MKKHILTVLLFCFLSYSNSANTCSIEIQKMLLANRQETILQAPIGMFDEKIATWSLEFKVGKLPLDKDDGAPDIWGTSNYADERVAVESLYLSANQMDKIKRARRSEDLQEATEILKGETGAFVAYTLATLSKPFEDNGRKFLFSYDKVPKPSLGIQNDPWRLWGLYMLAKTQFYSAFSPDTVESFQKVIDLVNDGLDDPLHVGADSLGWQARAYIADEEFDKAISNYLQLVAMGHTYASEWLRIHARNLVFSLGSRNWGVKETEDDIKIHKARLVKALNQPLTKKLLIIYAYTYLGSKNNILFDELLKTDLTNIAEVDQLAAYSYRMADYENAAKFSQVNNSLLSQIIQAKLLMRQGENDKASQIYSSLVNQVKVDFKQSVLSTESCDIFAESAVVLLANGEIDQAFDLLLNYTNGEYWQDVIYMAEHLLDTDTLLEKINALPINLTSHLRQESYEYINNKGKNVLGIERDYVTALRYLTARRLIREQRYNEAMELLPFQAQKEALQEYMQKSEAIEQSSGKHKAELLFEKAKWIRHFGWKLLAYEGYPDYLIFNINSQGELDSLLPVQSDVSIDKLVNQIEIDRLIANKTYDLSRFSYRYTAVKMAREAANLLVSTDDNYKKYLCYASQWILNKNAKLGYEIFLEYVRNAKPKESVKYFGQRCNG